MESLGSNKDVHSNEHDNAQNIHEIQIVLLLALESYLGATMTEETQATVVQYHDVTAAAYRIRRGVKETPLEVCALIILLMYPSCKVFSMLYKYRNPGSCRKC